MIRKVVVMEPNDYQPAHGNTGFARLTTYGRSHTLPRSVASLLRVGLAPRNAGRDVLRGQIKT